MGPLSRLALISALGLALASCGGDSGESEGSKPEPARASAPPKRIVAQVPGLPSAGKPQAPGTYTGAAGPGRTPYLAIVVQEGEAVVYVCDGKRASDWFGGPVKDGRVELVSERGTRLSAAVSESRVAGTLALRDVPRQAFSARPAKGGTGLYAFEDPTVKGHTARWIVTTRGLRGLSSTATGTSTNSLTITRTPSGTTTTDTRFAGTESSTALLNEVRALSAEVKAARDEDTSLRDTLSTGSKTGR